MTPRRAGDPGIGYEQMTIRGLPQGDAMPGWLGCPAGTAVS